MKHNPASIAREERTAGLKREVEALKEENQRLVGQVKVAVAHFLSHSLAVVSVELLCFCAVHSCGAAT